MSIGWDSLAPKALKLLEKHDFEDFVRELLDWEWRDRHHLSSRVDGPSPESTEDGGCDLLFSVKAPPLDDAERYRARFPPARSLTPETQCRAYSCKTGSTWRRATLTEAKKKSARVLEVLEDGGSFCLVVHVPVTKKDELVDELAKIYAARVAGGPSAGELRERIQIVDANDLCHWLRARRPRLSHQFAARLGVDDVPGLLRLDDWEKYHSRDRSPAPRFVGDAARAEISRQLVSALSERQEDPLRRALWIVGAPGVGKTRLVMEALKDDRLTRRVLVAKDAEMGLRAVLEYGVFKRFGDAILVVDDCSEYDADKFAFQVSSLRDSGGALVVITPRNPVRTKDIGLNRLDLHPLERDAGRAIVRGILGPAAAPEEDVARLAELAGGYPWFGAPLALEVAKLRSADPLSPSPRSVADAADLVIASKHEENPSEWSRTVIARTRALFAVLLTEDEDWAELDEHHRRALAEAVGAESFSQLEGAWSQCVQRNLVRRSAGGLFKYVTPEILAREVVRKLLCPPPDGPVSIRGRLKGLPARWAAKLKETALRLGFDAAELESFAKTLVGDDWFETTGLGFLKAGAPCLALPFVARYQPGLAARMLCQRIEAESLSVLGSLEGERRDLIHALEEAFANNGPFDELERALFRLALAENEAFTNSATNVWTSLFVVWRTFSDMHSEAILERLAVRSVADAPKERRLALHGIGAAVGRDELSGWAPRDGVSVAMASSEEGILARNKAWQLLLDRATDVDSDVAREAGRLLARSFRAAVRDGHLPGFAARLADIVARLDEGTLTELRAALHQVAVYDEPFLSRSRVLREGFDRIVAAATPRSFHERLMVQLTVMAGGTFAQHQQQDEALVREGLAPPDRPLAGEIDAIVSAAPRRMPLAIAAGKMDRERLLLGTLVARTVAGADPNALSGYCVGLCDREGFQELDTLLVSFRQEPALANATLLAIARTANVEADAWGERRVLHVTHALATGRVSDSYLGFLSSGKWPLGASTEAFDGLVAQLFTRGTSAGNMLVLAIVLERLRGDRSNAALRRLLVRAMELAAGGSLEFVESQTFTEAGTLLLELGMVAEVCRVVVRSHATGTGFGDLEHWKLVEACEHHSPGELWRAVQAALEEGGQAAWAIAHDFGWRGIGTTFPVSNVLKWVGRSTNRALLAALLVSVAGAHLPDLGRELIARFGPESPPARKLRTAACSSRGFVKSPTEFDRLQLDYARAWQNDSHPHVRAWAVAVEQQLLRALEFHSAFEEHERRRVGT